MDGGQGNVTQGDMQPPSSYGQQQQSYGQDPSFLLNEFQFDSEMGPVADMSTFPPTMAPYPPEESMGVLAVDNILSSGFWDSMLVPGKPSDQLYVFVMLTFFFPFLSGYNSMDCFSGGFIFGANGSGLITSRFGGSPSESGVNTPGRYGNLPSTLTQTGINAAFDQHKEGISIDA